jgi:predicted phage terminase large subunit-like protein
MSNCAQSPERQELEHLAAEKMKAMTPGQKSDLQETARARLARRRLALFVREAWPILEPGTPLIWSWHLDAICEHLQAVFEGRIRLLLINIPPGHMKSLIASVFWPAWMWIHRPGHRFLFASYGATPSPALRDSVKCRTVIASPWYRKHFGNGWKMAEDQNAKGYFRNTKLGERLSLHVGSGTGFRGEGMLVDDPIKADDAHSKIKRMEAIRWWDETMSSRLNDLKTGWRVIIMQRLHEEDLSGHVLQQGGYEHLCLPSEYDPQRRTRTSIGWEDPRHAQGELLFPAKFGPAELAQARKDLGADAYAGQHQQTPVADKGSIFLSDWFQRYRTPPADLEEVIQSWDLTFKGGDGTDFVAGQVWGRKGAHCYLLDRVCERMSYTRARQAIRDLSAKWPAALAKLIEDKANGPAIIDDLRDAVPGLVAVRPDGDKLARAHAVSPLCEAGNVWIPENAPWVNDWLHQITHFPRAAHDDEVDAMTQALRRLTTQQPTSGATLWAKAPMSRMRW